MNNVYDFDDYLHDRMAESDRREMEAALAADPQLARQMRALQAEEEIIRHLRKKDLQEKIARWKSESSPQPPTIARHRKMLRWGVAGLLLLLFAVALWIGQSPHASLTPPAFEPPPFQDSLLVAARSTPDTPTLRGQPLPTVKHATDLPSTAFFQHLLTDPVVGLYTSPSTFQQESMGNDGSLPDSSCYSQALAQYAIEHFPTAARVLDTCSNLPHTDEVFYLRAHTYFRLGRYAAAATEFGLIQKPGELLYDAQWYRLLSLLVQLPNSRKAFEA